MSDTKLPCVTDAQLIAELKSQIEALSENAPAWSKSAYTNRRTVPKAFRNGAESIESRSSVETSPWSTMSVTDLLTAQRVAITRYRESFAGPVDLVWRCEPEIRRSADGVSVYTRLSFEPTLIKVATGVWVEQPMTETSC